MSHRAAYGQNQSVENKCSTAKEIACYSSRKERTWCRQKGGKAQNIRNQQPKEIEMIDGAKSDNAKCGNAENRNGNNGGPIAKGVHVRLLGEDGNPFSIMGRVAMALRKAGRGDLVEPFFREATSGNYVNLIAVCMKYCECD